MKKTFLFIGITLTFFVGLIIVQVPAQAATCIAPPYAPLRQAVYSESTLNDLIKKAQLNYHQYINCLFEEATAEILPAVGEGELTTAAICTAQTSVVQSMQKTSPITLMEASLSAYNNYTDYLKNIAVTAVNQLEVKNNTELSTYIGRARQFQQLADQETQFALVAIDRSLLTFKEMRQAYLLHLHFRCMQAHLERFLTVLADLRKIVSGFPVRFKDASIH